MTPEQQKRIDKINSIAIAVFVIALILFVAILLIPKIWEIDTEQFAFKVAHNSMLTICAIAFVVAIISGLWATDEEKKRIIEALREIKEEEASERRNKIVASTDIKCPLIDVNENQKDAIVALLKRRIPKHDKDENRFDRSVVFTYLRALRAMHIMEPVKGPDDIDARRAWIEQITGLCEPQDQWAHFRGDYDEFKRNNKVRAAIKELEAEIAKIR